MTIYVVTVPGTFLTEPTPETRAELVRALRASDPRETDLGAAEDLDLLTLYPDSSAFSLRLEVEAADSGAAEAEARDLAADALRRVGLPADEAPLGDPVTTGITMA
ncbi:MULTISPECIES: hypothetical protein [unclassified Streptomyces]|uniref:hypothetical protein n=1 Tax=Streptomycetaceae TaxID=2062 RepID=UPI002E79DD84|nr:MULTISPECIES: hypothetical protein [unclassified Streptomyces]MED7950944.1 hypothetical protein [Streptomyces sp. BE303]MEE1825186.1 hypothetical protein [Streptomyces sp. BE20]